jgi:hypothetical protein
MQLFLYMSESQVSVFLTTVSIIIKMHLKTTIEQVVVYV